jgi:hypothetical protein
MEIYQWLFRKNNFEVSKTGYFLFCNGQTDRKAFDGKLEFDLQIIPYEGDDSWVESTIVKIKECLDQDTIPLPNVECEHCNYATRVRQAIK